MRFFKNSKLRFLRFLPSCPWQRTIFPLVITTRCKMNTSSKIYKKPFSTFVKKQKNRALKAAIEDEIDSICSDPAIGEAKVGDLSNIFIHKFSFKKQQYLIAYSFEEKIESSQDESAISFYQIGSHENFYEDLKIYLRSIGWYK
jgi:hypothetical protein